MDRILTVDHPQFAVANNAGVYEQFVSGYRVVNTNTFVHESTIDLGGYTRQADMTVYFRNSFEQRGGIDYVFWDAYDPENDGIIENVIISSVPFTDDQLIGAQLYQPGFTPLPIPGIDYGNFDRTHIIHGHFQIHYANSIIGSTDFTQRGSATVQALTDNNYSSLEPTAADTLYCYRVISCPIVADTQVSQIAIAPMRVLMSITTQEEPELSYMMRLKRSYELANQV
tara:strand:- start:1765 stop:2445 length:681 start_codon:yes stop_codon:yes gene_type:complete